ncbi:MAG: acetyl-CoA carboxylase biotin carboxyl carrier protein subunit [Bacteroidota bacterium]|nr:acetyl-CoA carboxylase biotin carboxyl carrier protein subunit [Bacteroidota bacterium]
MLKAYIKDKEYRLAVNSDFSGGTLNEQKFSLKINRESGDLICAIKDFASYCVTVIDKNVKEKKVTLDIDGDIYEVKLENELDILLKKMGISSNEITQEKYLKSPMPGLVLEIMAKEGDTVEEGEDLLILEAMKMENSIKSPQSGIIKQINIKAGDSVEKNKEMIEFE